MSFIEILVDDRLAYFVKEGWNSELIVKLIGL